MNQTMTNQHLYETETMAELCARQGRVGEAIAVYRRLLELGTDPAARGRWQDRVAALERAWRPERETEVVPADVPLPDPPGVTVTAADDQVTVAWALPSGTVSPAVEVLLIQRTPAGIETQKRTLPVAPSGRLGLATPGLHSAIAAVGMLTEARFVPLARSRR